MNQPRVLFADEPTGNLDADTGRQIMSVLERLHLQNRQTIVLVTHDRSLAQSADRVLVLDGGGLRKLRVASSELRAENLAFCSQPATRNSQLVQLSYGHVA